MIALQSLVTGTRLLGIPLGIETGVIKDMVQSFVEKARDLEGWKGLKEECAIQGAVDFGFLCLISGSDPMTDSFVQAMLAQVSPIGFFRMMELTIRSPPRPHPSFSRTCLPI